MILRCKTYKNDPKLLPDKAYDYPLGYDIKCPWDIDEWSWVSLYGYHYIDINTHLKIEFDPDFGVLLMPRSGLDKEYNVFLIPKVIDPDYRGPIWVRLVSFEGPIKIKKYNKIAQLVFIRRYNFDFQLTEDELNNTKRGTKGFGSSDNEN